MKDLLISKLREMVKVKKPKVKKTEPTESDRADFAAWQDRKEAEREPSDIEDERNQMAKHYGQQSEAIDFPKNTILGQAARPMAAKMLRIRREELQREPALASKGGAVAKELKAFSRETYRHRGDPKPERQRSSTDLRTQLAYVLANKLEEGWDKPKPQAPVKPKKPPKPLASKYVGPKKPPVTEELKARIAHILADKIDEIIIDRKNEKLVNPFKEPEPKIKDPKFDISKYLPKPKPKPSPEDLVIPSKPPLFMGKKPPVKEWTERIIKILVEMKRPAHLKADKYKISGAAKLQGLPYINKLRADRGQRPHPRSPLANDPKIMQKSTALGSVFSSQPLGPTEKAKVEADKAKEAADRPRVEAGLAKFNRDPEVAMIRRNNRRWSK